MVTFYSPDSHLEYNLHTLNKQGVGGGVTARIRMAHALAELGHTVTIYNHCPESQQLGRVSYHPFESAKEIETDIFIASTSGDGLDLSRLNEINIQTKLKILMVHGVDPPNGIDLKEFDYIYALSNFVRDRIVERWGIEAHKLFTAHRGVKEDHYHLTEGKNSERDPFGIVYSNHPSKGLEPAIKIYNILKRGDPRFSLHVYGGYSLWGEKENPVDAVPNFMYHGLVGQQVLANELRKYNYALNIQDREEPFGMSLIEAMRAGCIVLASSVGAFPEIIQNGSNGFLVKGKSNDKSTHQTASQLIMDLARNEGYSKYIRKNAIASPNNWRTVAKAWEGHWDWNLTDNSQVKPIEGLGTCPSCESDLLPLADGIHCIGCGRYQKCLDL